jgi:hypothetical protein
MKTHTDGPRDVSATWRTTSIAILLFIVTVSFSLRAKAQTTDGNVWMGNRSVVSETTMGAITKWAEAHPRASVRIDGHDVYVSAPEPEADGNHSVARFAPTTRHAPLTDKTKLHLVSWSASGLLFEGTDGSLTHTTVFRPDLLVRTDATAPTESSSIRRRLESAGFNRPWAVTFVSLILVFPVLLWSICGLPDLLETWLKHRSRESPRRSSSNHEFESLNARMVTLADRSEAQLAAARRDFDETVETLHRNLAEALR